MIFNKYIKIRRKEFISQEEFAKAVGLSYATINQWETEKAKPNLKTMKLIDDHCKKRKYNFILVNN